MSRISAFPYPKEASARRIISSPYYYSSPDERTFGVVETAPTVPTSRIRPSGRYISIPRESKCITVNDATIAEASTSTNDLNIWINGNSVSYDSSTYRRYGSGKAARWTFERQLETPSRIVKARAQSTSLIESRGLCNYLLCQQLAIAHYQAEPEAPKESDQGLAIQASDKQSSTIITRDEGISETTVVQRNECVSFASSEPFGQFEMLTSRWMPLDPIEVSTEQNLGDRLKSYYLPDSLYSVISKSANLVPFETFVYAEMDITFKFVVNANKFQCGKVLASSKFDTYQADALQNTVQAALHRPHVILDLASNNEGDLHVPFRYHRALVRLSGQGATNRGVRPKKYATVNVQVLSPLRTGLDNATNMFIRPFVKLENIKFCGISYRVDLQMEALGTLSAVSGGSDTLRKLLAGAESLLKDTSSTPNRDKPTDNRSTIIVPRPRLNFGTGKGPTDSLPLRMDPTSSTAFMCVAPYVDDPTTVLDIARIWGLRSTFQWSASTDPGTALISIPVDPSSRQYIERYQGVPTPLEYVTSLYNFWCGTMEMRFDFVSNAFHTGSVQISVEFGRPTADQDSEKLSASTYTKTFHLGEQKSCHITIPYIYDTVWRRSCSLPYNPLIFAGSQRSAVQRRATAVYPQSRTRVTVRVINELRPVQTAPQTIDVLVYWRASPSYRVHSLKQSSFVFTREITDQTRAMDNFPASYYGDEGEAGARRRRAADPDYDIPADEANEYGEYDEESAPVRNPKIEDSNDNIDDQQPQSGDGVYYQMDTGDKEDRDTTLDFNIGAPALEVQTNDDQLNLKDILRRPVLLFHNVTVTGLDAQSTHGFYVPLMPPSRNMALRSPEEEIVFSDLVSQTPQAQLMSLFRFWRGSMRYTIVVESADFKQPIYVTHMPHSGVRLIGNTRVMYRDGGDVPYNPEVSYRRPIYGTGLSTEMLIPQVNPTLQVEAPYDTENNWCLTFEEDPGRPYTWRDKGDTNTGHLVLTCQSDVRVSIWWSAGDDFEVANFWGIPGCLSNDAVSALPDIQYQMEHEHSGSDNEDFYDCDEEVPGRLVLIKRRALELYRSNRKTIDIGGTALVSQVPLVGPLVVAGKVSHLSAQVTKAIDKIGATTDLASEFLNNANDRLMKSDDMINVLYHAMLEVLQKVSSVGDAIPSFCTSTTDLLFDISSAIILKSWEVAATSLARLFVKFTKGLGLVSNLSSYITPLTHWFHNYFSDKPKLQIRTDPEATLIGLLVGLVGASAGVMLDEKKYESYIKKIGKHVTTSSTISYINGVVNLFQNVFQFLKELVMDLLGFVNPEARALKMFAQSNPLIKAFIQDAQLVTCEANYNMLSTPQFRTKFWMTVTNAYQIQSILCRLPSSAASPPLARLCADVIKASNERMIDLTSCPVRYESFTFGIWGAPGIGKSHLNNTLVAAMLKRVGFNRPAAGLVYVRQPGAKFWSGFRDQPVITYDDHFNLNDAELTTQALNELYQLKSPCVFIPEMAHLEDKRVKGNPLIVSMLCNNPYPKHISNVAINLEAVWRRRDVLVKAVLKRGWTHDMIRSMTKEQSENMAHLEFQIHRNPRIESAGYHDDVLQWDEFVDFMCSSFEVYHKCETAKVEKRLRELQSHLMNIPEERVNLNDPFRLFWEATHRAAECVESPNSWIPSEQLQMAVNQVSQSVADAYILPQKDVEQQGELVLDSLVAGLDNCVYASHKCSMCDQVRSTPAVCGAPEARHYYCADCITRTRIEGVCDVCDLQLAQVPLSGYGAKCLLFLRSCLVIGETEMTDIVHDITRLPLIKQIQLMLKFEAVAFTLSCFVSEKKSLIASATLGYMQWRAHRKREGSPKRAREVLPVAWKVRELVDAISHVEPYMERYDDFAARAKPKGVCTHGIIYNQLAEVNTTFHATTNSWRCLITDDSGSPCWLDCDDVPCLNNRECMLNSRDDCQIFYQRVCETKKDYLLKQYRDYFGCVANAPRIRERVPFMCRRQWMDPAPVELIRDDWWEFLPTCLNPYKDLLNVLVKTTSALAGVYCLYRVVAPFFGSPKHQGMDLNYERSQPSHLRRVHGRKIKIRGDKNSIKHQGEQQHLVVRDLVRNNYITLRVWDGDKCKRTLAALAICGKICIMPKHFLSYLDSAAQNGRVFTLEKSIYVQDFGAGIPPNHTRHQYTYDSSDFGEHATTDLAWFQLPNSFQSFRDIRKHFVLDADLTMYLPNTGTLELVPNSERKFIDGRSVNIYNLEAEIEVNVVPGEDPVLRDVVTYDFSQDGACGSVLITDRSQRPLLSIHTAGASRWQMGYGTIITQELLQELLPTQILLQIEDHDLDSIAERDDAFLLSETAKVEYLGCVPLGKENFTPSVSKIRPSLIHGAPGLEPTTAPTVLSSKDSRYQAAGIVGSPLFHGASKHGIRTIDFPTTLLDRIENSYYDGWISNMRPCVIRPKVLTPKEAIMGFPGIDSYDPIKLNTSVGYPYTKMRSETTKEAWMNVTRNEAGEIVDVDLDPFVVSEMERKHKLRLAGIQPLTLFADTLKDERKDKAKILKVGATRVFCGSPLDYTIQARQYLLHFCAAFTNARFDVMSGVGINAKGKEWTDLYHYLTKTGANKFVTLDYSNFGPAFNAQIASRVCRIISRWTRENVEDVEANVVEMLLYECMNSCHIVRNTVYQQFSGSPSGAPTTTIFNSVENNLIILGAWDLIMRHILLTQGITDIWREFRENVRVAVYGDDVIMSVTDKYIALFNINTIRNTLARYQIVATTADKTDGDSPDWVPLSAATFLKRSFKAHPYRPGVWLSPLKWASVNDASQWIWSSPDELEATLVNCESALSEAHGHGPEAFYAFRRKINDALRLRRIRGKNMTTEWADLDNTFFPEYELEDRISFQMEGSSGPDPLWRLAAIQALVRLYRQGVTQENYREVCHVTRIIARRVGADWWFYRSNDLDNLDTLHTQILYLISDIDRRYVRYAPCGGGRYSICLNDDLLETYCRYF